MRQRPGRWLEARNALHCSGDLTAEWNTISRRLETVDAVTKGRYANGAGNVGANSEDGAAKGDESALAAARSTGRQVGVVWVQRSAEDVVFRVAGLEDASENTSST